MSATQTLGGQGDQGGPLSPVWQSTRASTYNPLPPARSRIGARRRFPCLRMGDPRSPGGGTLRIQRDFMVWWTPRKQELLARLEYEAGRPVRWIEERGDFANIWQSLPPHINTTAKAKAWLWKRRQKGIGEKIAFYQKELEKMKGVKLDGNY